MWAEAGTATCGPPNGSWHRVLCTVLTAPCPPPIPRRVANAEAIRTAAPDVSQKGPMAAAPPNPGSGLRRKMQSQLLRSRREQ